MARRPQLTAEQRSALFDPPRLPRELVRHYTLSGGDLDLVLRCRGDHNRLGYAVQLAYLRCPGGVHPGSLQIFTVRRGLLG
jgi:hypothetical protein